MRRAFQRELFRALLLIVFPAVSGVHAQSYPARPIRMVIPFPAGGTIEVVGRPLATKLSEALGQIVIIDNRPGANGVTGSTLVAKAPADGHTLLLAPTGPMVISPALQAMPYDVLKDFAPITVVVNQPMCLVVSAVLPVKSVPELIALAKERPGRINFASAGVGNAIHLAGEMFKTAAGIDIVHVPYKGTPMAVTELIAGQVHMMISSIPGMLPQIKAGRLRPLAVTAATRLELFPAVPTMREAGFPDYKASSWYGLLAPAGTPPAIVTTLNREAAKIMRSVEIREYLHGQGSEAVGNSVEEFRTHLRAELKRWAGAVKSSGAKAD
jgi:tripartite-type tricarboxylate transporter receptor subunit TctC